MEHIKRILSGTRRALDDYRMINPNDRIAVGVSAGKDSLTLLCALAELRRFYPVPFTLQAVTVDMGFAGGTDFSPIRELCENLEVPYAVIPTEIAKIVFEIRKEPSPCSLCAKLRRGALYNAAGELGCNTVALGHHLDDAAETLMLNLVFLKDGRYVWAENMPAWEQPTMTTAKKREIPLPDNQAELLTLQSRRLILSREENRVTGFSSTGGDFFGKEGRVNAFSEQMTLWRAGKTPKNAVPQFVPASVDPWRQMWRDFEVILGSREDTHIPGVVAWLTELRRKNVIPRKYVHIASVGVTYDSKKGSIADIISDHLDFQMSLLDAAGELWIVLVGGEIHLIDKVARALGALAEGLYLAQGGQLDGAGKKARQSQRDEGMRLLYAAVDFPFREWLAHIGVQHGDDENTRTQEQQCWRSTVFRIADNLGREMVRDAGTAAFTGRWVVNEMAETNGRFFTKTNGERKSVFYSSPTEYNRYLSNLKSMLKNATE